MHAVRGVGVVEPSGGEKTGGGAGMSAVLVMSVLVVAPLLLAWGPGRRGGER